MLSQPLLWRLPSAAMSDLEDVEARRRGYWLRRARENRTAEMVLIGLLGLAGAALFGLAGLWMLSLRSVNGGTVAEAFDQAMGLFSLGMAALSLLVAASAATRR